jgi:hypothetical protein
MRRDGDMEIIISDFSKPIILLRDLETSKHIEAACEFSLSAKTD